MLGSDLTHRQEACAVVRLNALPVDIGPVQVTGTPQLMLVIGSERVAAQYDAGSGGTTLDFRYTVLPGQRDLDGIAIESLGLNGGRLRNADGVDAVLVLAGVGSTAGITVGAVAPDAPTITAVRADDGTATVTFDPPLQNGGVTVLDYIVTVQPGGTFETEANAFYLEDIWNITPNLMLNLGVRWDRFENRTADGDAFIKMDDLIAPRFGFSWDMKGDGSTKLFGNAGA